MKIKLICDSLCDIPEEIQNKEYIEVVPLTIIFGEKEYKDGIDITKEDYYKLLKNSETLPKTSQATYIQFSELFNKYLEEGYHIICINGSSKSSGTYQSAVLAKNDIEEGKEKIHVFDTLSLSLGSGQFVIKASELIEEGLDCNFIMDTLESMRESVTLLFAPSTLEYLKKSGRVSVTSAIIGNMLNLKPIFSFPDGEAKLTEKVRGNKHLVTRLVDLILEVNDGNLENKIVTIGCGDNYNEFQKLKKELETRVTARRILFARGGACICSHTGPDILAISCSD